MQKNLIAAVSTSMLALVIVGMAAADPGGLFAIVSWIGWHPVAQWWWWAPYLLFIPLALMLNFVAVHSLVAAALPNHGRFWLFFRIWLIVIVATACAWSINAMLVLYASMASREYVLSTSGTLAFMLWSSGYATLKMACLGWLPALPGLLGRADGQTPRSAGYLDGVALFGAGLTMLLVALISPWLEAHWWHGSPVGYIYQEMPRLPAPVPFVGIVAGGGALLVCGLMLWCHQRRSHVRVSAMPVAVLTAGAIAGVTACLMLFVVQMVILYALGLAVSDHNDNWFIPASVLLAVETSSFALIVAVCSAITALAGYRLRNWNQKPLSATTLNRLGILCGAFGIVVLAGLGWRGHAEMVPQEAQKMVESIDDKLSPVTVRHDPDRAILVNQHGSQVTLRGVNVNQLGEYYLADAQLAPTVPLTRTDFADMASMGQNVVRLTLSWSRLEPQRGKISQQYIDQIRQAVNWAAQYQIYVVLDIHQDAWSTVVVAPKGVACRAGTEPMKGWDGAPGWATLTDDTAPCQFTGRDLAPNVSRAFESFYFDRDDIQSALVHAWGALAANFADNPTVLGYDLLNEPNFAETPPITSTLLLSNFYARTIAAIRKAEMLNTHGYAHPVVIEPSIFWSGFGVDNLPPAGFSPDNQLVYSPHLYNESITSDQDLGINLVSIERGFRLAQHAAAQIDAALWIGEWGFFGDATQQASLWARQASAEDAGNIGSALWIWKQGCGDPHVYPGKNAGNFVQADCPDNQPNRTDPIVRQTMQRAYVRTAPGRILQSRFGKEEVFFAGAVQSKTQAWPLCDVNVWWPGPVQPQMKSAQGIVNLSWQRVEPGSAVSGSEGGWILHGCVNQLRYEVQIVTGASGS